MSDVRPAVRRPGPVRAWFIDFPVHLFRAHLGWLFGGRLVVLVHRGRRSGEVRRTVLEVIRKDPSTGERLVLSGRGVRSDWFRNIDASPALELWVGRHRFRVEQRILEGDEQAVEFRRYVDMHPRLAVKVMGELGAPGDPEAAARLVRIIAFRPVGPV
jgi:deazaflavin-dependent oxidoreductase (nitroreductase family)